MNLTKFCIIGYLLFSKAYAVDTCFLPFADRNEKFYLQSELDCDKSVNQHRLAILQNDSFTPINDDVSYLAPTCFDTKVLNLYHGKIIYEGIEYDHILHFMDNITPGDNSVFRVSKACDGETIGIIDTNIQDLTLEDGSTIKTCFQMKENNAEQSVIAYVRVDDHDSNNFDLRSVNGTILATAGRTFGREGDSCFFNWEVDNTAGFDPTILAYAIGWRENQAFNCEDLTSAAPTMPPTPAMPPAPIQATSGGLSNGAITGITIGSVGAVALTGCLVWKYFGKRIRAAFQTPPIVEVPEYIEAQTPVSVVPAKVPHNAMNTELPFASEVL